ncbi:MAG: ribose-phosphate pyrophosphokinase [Candidatus Riflebacteria bacterium RBG_13_59_9]|nr:MAG: ribose-phosphate pyrophosphokinase [Candidatus Riflebacteria bacterium RBG_13_59_9]
MSVEHVHHKKLTLIAGNANYPLAEAIAKHLATKLSATVVKRFSDGEVRVQVDESIRGHDVFIIQPTCSPVNENLVELLVIIDAVRRASAHRIVAVIPYYGYARQDKKVQPREAISARLVANLIETAGADRMISMDLHSGALQGFFNIPVDHLSALKILSRAIEMQGFTAEDSVIISPDVGGVERASEVATRLGFPLAIIAKRRPEPNVAEIVEVIGDIEGRNCILYDDMVDTAGSVTVGAKLLMERGAKSVSVYATHGVLSGEALKRIGASPIERLVITDTIPLDDAHKHEKIKVASTAATFAEAIKRCFTDESISSLFR